VRVAVNLAMRQLADEGLVNLITETLAQTGLAPEFLELELTETDVMQEAKEMSHKLRCLKDLGVFLSLDDFGTGYSSLSYLKRFAFDCLKIDRSFVQDMTTDPEDKAIVQTIIAVAKNLGMTVLAEGVETAETLECLRAMGCQQVQGYLIGRPVPPDQSEQLLRTCSNGRLPLGWPLHGAVSGGPEVDALWQGAR
jgi:EAL domain-containing protein (putative c-di-GMP-specific phosphodiesterase class I)